MDLRQNIRLAVDAIIFGYKEGEIKVLLIMQKFGVNKGRWVLPGGFVLNEEGLKEAANRELMEEAGIKVDYLDQLYTFGDDINRDPRMRVVSVAYYGIVNSTKLVLKADTDAEDANWFSLSEIPTLPFDHNAIIDVALERLKTKLKYHPIGFDLLDKLFPFSDLENLYSIILGKEIDRRNFRKKIMSFGFVEETNQYMPSTKKGRPGKLYKFNKTKYQAFEKKGFLFEVE
jgi:8-oxo-dGTP diphosphatase